LRDDRTTSREGRSSPSRDSTLVLFDLGGVACRFVPERRLQLFASACEKSASEVHEILWASGFSRSCDRGELSGEEMHERVCALLGWPGRYDEFRRVWASAFEPDPQVLTLVDAVRRNHRTGLLTDNPPVIREALQHELSAVGRRFDLFVFSCELGATKPAPELFQSALGRIGRRPEEVIFIDDVRENVAAAAALGIAAVPFTTADALAADLLRLNVLP
jgi:putative hydrolase of the HAD superfamily